MKRAYSYIRFSTAEQLKGKSLERQTEAARIYCERHELELDTELSLQDLGVSAFRGKNSDTGALGSFLRAVHSGQVPKGSLLLIETFDRMSRESAYDAQLTLQNIINAGITVVTLMDGKQYNVQILRTDPVAIIMAVVLMMRGHEESSTKSKRVADAWRRKRTELAAKTGKAFTALTPGWIKLDRHRRPQLIRARVKIVRRIFTMYLAGDGPLAIAGTLSKEHVPTFKYKHGRWWSRTYIKILLRNRAVLGELQPHRMEHNALKRKRVPAGEPIKNHWPAIIDAKTFNKAQARLAETRGKRITQTRGLKNILAGVGRCPVCDSLMVRVIRRATGPRLVCARAQAGAGCRYRGVPIAVIEAALARGASVLAAEVPDTTAELLREVAALEATCEELQTRIFDMATLLSNTPSKTVAQRIQTDEAECERLRGEIAKLNAQLIYGSARRVKDSVARMKSALQWHKDDPSDVAGVNAALRECFEKIVVNYQHTRLEMHWRHGQTTAVPY